MSHGHQMPLGSRTTPLTALLLFHDPVMVALAKHHEQVAGQVPGRVFLCNELAALDSRSVLTKSLWPRRAQGRCHSARRASSPAPPDKSWQVTTTVRGTDRRQSKNRPPGRRGAWAFGNKQQRDFALFGGRGLPCIRRGLGKSDWGGHGKDCGREGGERVAANGKPPEIYSCGTTVTRLREMPVVDLDERVYSPVIARERFMLSNISNVAAPQTIQPSSSLLLVGAA